MKQIFKKVNGYIAQLTKPSTVDAQRMERLKQQLSTDEEKGHSMNVFQANKEIAELKQLNAELKQVVKETEDVKKTLVPTVNKTESISTYAPTQSHMAKAQQIIADEERKKKLDEEINRQVKEKKIAHDLWMDELKQGILGSKVMGNFTTRSSQNVLPKPTGKTHNVTTPTKANVTFQENQWYKLTKGGYWVCYNDEVAFIIGGHWKTLNYIYRVRPGFGAGDKVGLTPEEFGSLIASQPTVEQLCQSYTMSSPIGVTNVPKLMLDLAVIVW